MNNKITNGSLALVVVIMAALCVLSILRPLRFDGERAQREQAVKQRLLKIRAAQSRYLKTYGEYCASMDSLVAKGFLPDSLSYVPFGDGRRFDLATSVKLMKSGTTQPLMECSARYSDYLTGLDDDEIAEITEEANTEGRFPGLKIGSLDAPNDNAGNWE